jgi:hypothetical protein
MTISIHILTNSSLRKLHFQAVIEVLALSNQTKNHDINKENASETSFHQALLQKTYYL